jgi:hypothetical protein
MLTTHTAHATDSALAALVVLANHAHSQLKTVTLLAAAMLHAQLQQDAG